MDSPRRSESSAVPVWTASVRLWPSFPTLRWSPNAPSSQMLPKLLTCLAGLRPPSSKSRSCCGICGKRRWDGTTPLPMMFESHGRSGGWSYLYSQASLLRAATSRRTCMLLRCSSMAVVMPRRRPTPVSPTFEWLTLRTPFTSLSSWPRPELLP